jgi:hypothetical protein
MDSSDITRRRKAQAIYGTKIVSFTAANPAGDCANLSACCTATTNCVRNFNSYDTKYAFYRGRNACVTGAAALGDFSWGVQGCTLPVTGGSR